MLYIIPCILIISFLYIISRKRQDKIDERNEFEFNKHQHDFYAGKNKPKMGVNYRGKLIEMDEHFSNLIEPNDN